MALLVSDQGGHIGGYPVGGNQAGGDQGGENLGGGNLGGGNLGGANRGAPPYGPGDPRQPAPPGWQQPHQPTGPQGWHQPGQPTGPQGWQQPGQPTGPQGWQQPTGPQGWQQPTGPQGWQQPGPQGWQQPGQPTGPQGWQQPGQPTGPQGWQQPAPQQGWQQPGQPQTPPSAPASKNRTPVIVTAIAVVVALLAGAGVWFFAIRDTQSASGQESPQAAVNALFTSLSNSDPIGLAGQLDPAEASLFTDLNADVLSELKRLDVLGPSASTTSLTGTSITVSGLTFDPTDETINDNLRVVKLTGGTVTIASNPDQLPLSDKIKSKFADQISQAEPQSQTLNIADAVSSNGGPIRIATVQRDGAWYVSLFYSIADNVTHQAGLPNPTAADRIAAIGSPSPEAAVDAFIKKASEGDIKDVIALTAPDEMGVLHDYGTLLVDNIGTSDLTSGVSDLGFTVENPSWTVSDVTGGKKVSLASLTVSAQGQTATITRDPAAGSLTVDLDGQTQTLDQSTIEDFIAQAGGSQDLDPTMVDIIKREFQQIIGLGIVTVQVDSKWYLSPVRSLSDIGVSLLEGLQPSDVDYLISLAGN